MAEYNESQIKFGWLDKSQMVQAIQDGDLNSYDICFTKDTHEQYLINSKLEPISIKSRLRIYGSVESAIQDINNDKSLTYPGEILSIRDGEKFIAYVVNELDDEYFVTPVYADRMVDYNGLTNIPIKNLNGSISEPIIVSSLSDGYYKITGRYTAPNGENVNTVVGDFIVISTDSINIKTIKRITDNSIFDYHIEDEVVTVDRYATESYINSQGFATQTYVTNAISALQVTMKAYIEEYVATTCTLLIKHMISEELDARYAVQSDIENLFD